MRRCEQLQNFQGIWNLHRRILEELRGCAARDHNLLWVDNAGRVHGRKVECRALPERAASDGQCPELSDCYHVDLRELLDMDLELLIEKGSLARALCEGLPSLLQRDHQHQQTSLWHLSSFSSAPSTKGNAHEEIQPRLAEK